MVGSMKPCTEGCILQRQDTPNLLVTLGTWRRGATKIHSFQHRVCNLWNSKRTSQDTETLGKKIPISCPEHQGLHTTHKMHPIKTRWMHHVLSTGVLLEEYSFHIPRQVLLADGRCCYGCTNQSHSDKSIYGGFWGQSHQYITSPPFSVGKICWWHIHSH